MPEKPERHLKDMQQRIKEAIETATDACLAKAKKFQAEELKGNCNVWTATSDRDEEDADAPAVD